MPFGLTLITAVGGGAVTKMAHRPNTLTHITTALLFSRRFRTSWINDRNMLQRSLRGRVLMLHVLLSMPLAMDGSVDTREDKCLPRLYASVGYGGPVPHFECVTSIVVSQCIAEDVDNDVTSAIIQDGPSAATNARMPTNDNG